MGLFWKQVFAGSNPAARTKPILDFGFRILNLRVNPKLIFHARVAQSEEALVLETRGCEFESLHAYQIDQRHRGKFKSQIRNPKSKIAKRV